MTVKNRIATKIADLMADARVGRLFSFGRLLQLVAELFTVLVRLRNGCYRKGLLKTHRLPCVVISIGNITSGGTGKTPMTLYVAALLRRLGYRTVILSRGYKGGAEKRGGIVTDGERLLMTPAAAGDEPFMMARFLENIPVLVGRDRVASGRLAATRFAPDILLLDDGFQHQRLHRDMDIVLLDSRRPFGNTFLLPRGSLREPPDALARAHALVFTRWRDGFPDPVELLPASAKALPVFRSRNIPYIHDRVNLSANTFQIPPNKDTAGLKGTRVFAFSAIADNADFHRVLTDLGCQVTGKTEFADHHTYSPRELQDIGRKAVSAGAEVLVTTQKDFSKLPATEAWPLSLVVLGVLPFFSGAGNDFEEFLKNAVVRIMGSRQDTTGRKK